MIVINESGLYSLILSPATYTTWIHVSIRRDGKNRQVAGRLRKK